MKLKDYGETTFVTGLRAWAILGVLLVHAGGAGLSRLGQAGALLVDFGRTGVYCFFVVSGFSVASSYLSAGSFWAYLFRRFMRLAPLYYAFLLLSLLVFTEGTYWSSYLGHTRDLRDLLYHLTFLHAFSAGTASSFFGVEWSLSVEMFWYLWCPWLLKWVDRDLGLALILAGIFWRYGFLAWYEAEAKADPKVALWVLWNPLKYFLSYALGVWAFRCRTRVPEALRSIAVMGVLAFAGCYGAWSAALGRLAFSPYYASTIITASLLVFGSSREPVCRALWMNRFMLVVGTLSYGMYLNHMFVLEFFKRAECGACQDVQWIFFILVPVSLLFAWVTYRVIELPGQVWAKRIEKNYFSEREKAA